MASDTFLQIDGIKGESTDDKHKDWIEIHSYSGAGVPDASGVAEAEAKGKVEPGNIVITRPIDVSSPKLSALVSSGKHIKEAVLATKKTPGKYLTITMTDVTISSVKPLLSAHDKPVSAPTESLTLNYGTIMWTYTQQK